MPRCVLYSPELGVFLGTCMGLGFWSKLDPVGQPEAVTFEIGKAPAGSEFDVPDAFPVPIDCQESYATIAECIAAGLPGWNPDVASGPGEKGLPA